MNKRKIEKIISSVVSGLYIANSLTVFAMEDNIDSLTILPDKETSSSDIPDTSGLSPILIIASFLNTLLGLSFLRKRK